MRQPPVFIIWAVLNAFAIGVILIILAIIHAAFGGLAPLFEAAP